MNAIQQFAGIFRSVAAPRHLSAHCWGLVLGYLVAGAVVLGATAALLVANQDHLRQVVIDYLFPHDWHFAADLLIDYFLRNQTKLVLINAAASGSLIIVSVLLFPLKERLSSAFEADARLTGKPTREFPLWFQALEELKLVLLYLTSFMLIFWIGHHPDPSRRLLATGLSYGFIFYTFAIDFVAPLLQRHRARYSQVLKVLLKHPIASVGFGALFAAPSIFAGAWVSTHPDLSISRGILLLFGANLLAIAWAAIGGTWLAAQLLESTEATRRTSVGLRMLAWSVLLGAFAANSYRFASLGRAIHHKSQILKCSYSIDWGSVNVQLPHASGGSWKAFVAGAVDAVVNGEIHVSVRFKLRVDNPTQFDVELEQNRIEISHHESVVARISLAPMKIAAHQHLEHPVHFKLRLDPHVLRKGRELFRDRWRITLFLRVQPHFEFPIYLLSPENRWR